MKAGFTKTIFKFLYFFFGFIKLSKNLNMISYRNKFYNYLILYIQSSERTKKNISQYWINVVYRLDFITFNKENIHKECDPNHQLLSFFLWISG